jgi:hypothetical protein
LILAASVISLLVVSSARAQQVVYDVKISSADASLYGTITANVATNSFIASDLGFSREASGTFIGFSIPQEMPLVHGSVAWDASTTELRLVSSEADGFVEWSHSGCFFTLCRDVTLVLSPQGNHSLSYVQKIFEHDEPGAALLESVSEEFSLQLPENSRGFLVATAVPEPSSLSLGMLGMLVFWHRKSRRT